MLCLYIGTAALNWCEFDEGYFWLYPKGNVCVCFLHRTHFLRYNKESHNHIMASAGTFTVAVYGVYVVHVPTHRAVPRGNINAHVRSTRFDYIHSKFCLQLVGLIYRLRKSGSCQRGANERRVPRRWISGIGSGSCGLGVGRVVCVNPIGFSIPSTLYPWCPQRQRPVLLGIRADE